MILLHDVVEIFGVPDNDGRLVHLVVPLNRCRVGFPIGMEQFWSLRDFSFSHKQLRNVSSNGRLARHSIRCLRAYSVVDKTPHLAISKNIVLSNRYERIR
jgi:hypothetical protein